MAIEVALEFRALLKLCRALVNILETLPNKKKCYVRCFKFIKGVNLI